MRPNADLDEYKDKNGCTVHRGDRVQWTVETYMASNATGKPYLEDGKVIKFVTNKGLFDEDYIALVTDNNWSIPPNMCEIIERGGKNGTHKR